MSELHNTASSLDPLSATDVTSLRGVGEQLAEKLTRLGIFTLSDLLLHLPKRYVDRTRVTPIGSLRPQVSAVIEGEVRAADVVFGRRRSLLVKLQDHSGVTNLRFFHFSRAQAAALTTGLRLRCFGEARRGAAGLEFYHPEYQRVDEHSQALEDCLTPIYPITDGISQQRMRALIQQAVSKLQARSLCSLLPGPEGELEDFGNALRFLHNPPANAALEQLSEGEHPLQRQLIFEELVAHHVSLLAVRGRARRKPAAVLPDAKELVGRFLDALPFSLTEAQQRVQAEIAADLGLGRPMLRMVQGDVGCGKTVVAALACLQAVAGGFQAAIMAPTEILAEQHRRSFESWLAPLGIGVGWLSGRVRGREREATLAAVAAGELSVVVGTHALFQEDVVFHRLALTIIDEQHRFGVHQRLALVEKGHAGEGVDQEEARAHQLIMTATPIPRSLAMTVFADLDCSVIDALPPGRSPVNTVLIDDQRRGQVIERVRSACLEGRQAYWVCTLIDESEAVEAQAAAETCASLAALLPELKIGLVHGRLKAAEKETVMQAFKAGELHLLVATTVIEVGVDVPNASLMIIENPERLGLAQLHQLRGRVGRGSTASHCVLLYSKPLSGIARQRLDIMRRSNDGFYIAEQDLQLRGPGEVLGTRQTGDVQFKLADLQRDAHLLGAVKNRAQQLLREQPTQVPLLVRRWLAYRDRYGGA